MVRIAPFAVEQWMDEYETTPGVLNIAETCAASISLEELVGLSEDTAAANPIDASAKLVYGAIRGSEELRQSVVAQYSKDGGSKLSANDVLITQGAIGANFLALYTLIGPSDHVVCVYPTYQQLYSVPESVGAEVSLWRLRKDNRFIPDVAELEALVQTNTKMIILNNPNNPTGAAIPSSVLRQIVSFAQERGILILSDEVYRPLFHNLFDDEQSVATGNSGSSTTIPSTITSFGYPNVLVTGSMSKAYALAGIRLGWVASPNKDLIARLASARDYTTISVSRLDDAVATYALSPPVVTPLLRRNVALAKANVALLEQFVLRHAEVCSWVKPVAGTTAFVQFRRKGGDPVSDVDFCLDLLDKTKVFFVPGSKCFGGQVDFQGYVRIGFVCHTDVLEEGLAKLDDYVKTHLY